MISLVLLAVLHFTYVSSLVYHSNCLSDYLTANSPGIIHQNISYDILGVHVSDSRPGTGLNGYCYLENSEIINCDSLINSDLYEQTSSKSILTDRQSKWNLFQSQTQSSSVNTPHSYLYLFSAHKGYLLLPTRELRLHNISRVDVHISSRDKCFGPRVSSFLLRTLTGYDTVVENWLIRSFGGKGFLHITHAQVIPIFATSITQVSNLFSYLFQNEGNS
jgi:hypothetical protein